ncbi:MAG: zinc ribbon domain-containing protein, partial [Dehalococcoidia bacterium]
MADQQVCPNCGRSTARASQFCPSCGTALTPAHQPFETAPIPETTLSGEVPQPT